MSLQVISTILDSAFAFIGLGKEVAVTLAGYKEGTYLGRPATLALLKVSNNGKDSNAVTKGYDFVLRVKEHTPPVAKPSKRGAKPIASHPTHVAGATVVDRIDEGSLLSEASHLNFGFSKQPTLDMAVPSPVVTEYMQAERDLNAASQRPLPPLPSNIPIRPTPLCVSWAPNSVETVMFTALHRLKKRDRIGGKIGETDQIPGGIHVGHDAAHSIQWVAEDHYSIFTEQRKDGVQFCIRGPGREGTGVPSALLVGIVITHNGPAKLKVYPASRTFAQWVTIRKALAVPTTPVHDEFLPTCRGIQGVCTRETCREFGREHLTDKIWRSLIGCNVEKFIKPGVSCVLPL